MESAKKTFQKSQKITWYRCKVDPKLMGELMQCSDWEGFKQAGGHLVLWLSTGTLAYISFRNITAANWLWSVPLLWLALFAHGSVGVFMGGAACHELGHKTPFRTKSINDVFLKVFAFIGWWNHVYFRPSHIRHHQVTVYHDYDGEVVLPLKLEFKNWRFWLSLFGWHPYGTFSIIKTYYRRAMGHLDNDWYEFVLPEDRTDLRQEHRNWARFTLIGHAVLVAIFVATGHWFLIFIFNLGTQYCFLMGFLTHMPQHYGMTPDVPDHRQSVRTYTCSKLPAFLYWNMQYHIEHHLFPAVPFYNLGKLHRAIEYDLPPTPDGLWATWKGILEIDRKSTADPKYCFTPTVPTSEGDHAEDGILEREASLGF